GIYLRGRQRYEARGKIGQQLLQAEFFRQLRLDPLPPGLTRRRPRMRVLHGGEPSGSGGPVFGEADPRHKTVTTPRSTVNLRSTDGSSQPMGYASADTRGRGIRRAVGAVVRPPSSPRGWPPSCGAW